MDGVNSTKVILCSLVYPIEILISFINIFIKHMGVYLQLDILIFLSEKERNRMTDNEIEKWSDALDSLKESEDEDEQE